MKDEINKAELTQKLKAISERYTESQPLKNSDSTIHDFANCLNHPDLAEHLLETEICPDEEEIKDCLSQYETAEAIISSYQEMYDILESTGLVEKSESLQELNS